MLEKILKLAEAIAQPSEVERALLEALCTAAQAEVAARLGEAWTPETCEDTFCCAAAMLAAAGLFASRTGGEVESFTAGEVSVRTGSGGGALEAAAALRRQAEALMAGYWGDDSFAFVGVKG